MRQLDIRAFPTCKSMGRTYDALLRAKKLQYLVFFGSLALLVLVNQFVTGILLTMNYKPDAKLAFDSVEYIMRDVHWAG